MQMDGSTVEDEPLNLTEADVHASQKSRSWQQLVYQLERGNGRKERMRM